MTKAIIAALILTGSVAFAEHHENKAAEPTMAKAEATAPKKNMKVKKKGEPAKAEGHAADPHAAPPADAPKH